ncbi:hypothetical protein B0H10DRAFT_2057857 [Mycena sp. CBHHK59/15]|nr:hypothetical protein B0H10DRAFT_2057857 [Mycena sp. CBHHK59/15]
MIHTINVNGRSECSSSDRIGIVYLCVYGKSDFKIRSRPRGTSVTLSVSNLRGAPSPAYG